MMENSKIEKEKVFASRIPVMKKASKPSNEFIGNKETGKAEDAMKYCIKKSAAIEIGRRLAQVTNRQNENRKTTSINSNNTDGRRLTNAAVHYRKIKTTESSLSNRKCTNISTKTVNKKPTVEPVVASIDRKLTNAAVRIGNEKSAENSLANRRCTGVSTKTVSQKATAESISANKKVNFVRNQSDNKKSTYIEISNMNRRMTNVNNSKLKAPTHSQRNIVNRRLTNISRNETKRPIDIAPQNKGQTNKSKQQTTRCNNKERKIDEVQGNLFLKSKQDDVKPCKDTSLNHGPSSSILSRGKNSVQANDNNFNHFTQPDIEFVADEKYRQQILAGRELTPNLKPFNKVKCSSIYERQSLFKSSQAPFDIKTALKRLEDEGRRISMMKMNGAHPDSLASPSKYERQSLFKSSQTPFDINTALRRLEDEGRRNSVMKMSALSSSQLAMKNQPSILKAIENVNHASENRRAFAMKSNPLHVASPRLDRDHIHQRSASAYETVLKRLEDLHMKKKVKSSKKVTFNLETSDSSHRILKPDKSQTRGLKPTVKIEKNHCFPSKLEQKTPVSKPHSSTESPSLPDKVKRDLTGSHYNAMLLRICGRPRTTPAQDKVNHLQQNTIPSIEIQLDICSDEQPPASSLKTPSKKDFTLPSTPTLACANETSTPTLKGCTKEIFNFPSIIKSCAKETSISCLSPVEKMSIATHSAISQSVEPDFKTYNRLTNSICASSALRSSLYLSRSHAVRESGLRRNTLSRLCTPVPVSFYPRVNVNNEISPEFMGRRTSVIVANAPISTPMVLRNLAESFEETLSPVAQDTISPVCQRLDFDELEENEDAAASCESSSELQKRPVKNVFTRINIMDQLTDQECCEILKNEVFSVIFEGRLLNPIAQILSHGDDMHFVPLKITQNIN